jgi:hypothetical protein
MKRKLQAHHKEAAKLASKYIKIYKRTKSVEKGMIANNYGAIAKFIEDLINDEVDFKKYV